MIDASAAWPRTTIDQVCSELVDCVNRTAPVVEDETPYKMIRTTNIKGGFIDLSQVRYVTRQTYEHWTRRQIPQIGDVILTREAPLGEVARVRTTDRIFLGQRLFSYRPNPSVIDSNFLFYTMRGPDLQQQIKALGAGATVEHMRVPDAKKLVVPLPPLPTQQRIGAILSAYDDLIEVNRRRVAILEEMARRLFEEWFVRLRFPGHEAVPVHDTPDGPVPEGWQFGCAADLLDIDPATSLGRTSPRPFIPMSSLDTTTSIIGEIEVRGAGSGAKFRNGDTLFARITPCLENGKTGLVRDLPGDGVGFGSTEYIVMRPRLAGSAFVYQLARFAEFREHARRSMSGATGRQRARAESLKNFAIVIPPKTLLDQFEQHAWPTMQLVGQLGASNSRLAAARDLLLPRLISGGLSIAEAPAPERLLEAAD